MNFKLLLLPVMALAPAMSFADEYFISPNGTGDGKTMGTPMGIEEFRTQAASNVNGDIYNLLGGSYVLSTPIVFKTGSGFTLNGSVDGVRTVLSGDKDGNGNAGAGDASVLVSANASTAHDDKKNPISINGLDFTCVYTNVQVTAARTTAVGALYIDNSGAVEVNDCRFYNNWSNNNVGGPAVFVYRSTAIFTNCVFKNNKAAHRGGAVRLASSNDNRIKEFITFDRCQFTGNICHGKNGGAIFMEAGSQLNIVNSTIADNSTKQGGGAIYVYDTVSGSTPNFLDNKLNIIGSTIVNNTAGVSDDGSMAAQIEIAESKGVNVVNSIITSNSEDVVAFKTTGAEVDFVSGGWNYVNADVVTVDWQSTDKHGDAYNYATIFGDNALEDGVIRPAHYVLEGATGAQTQAAVADWGIYHSVDYAVDQLGDNRGADMTNGAVAVKKTNTGVDDVIANGAECRLVKIADGVYRIVGANCIEAYNIMGSRVAVANGDVISLENAANGMYVIKAGSKSFKIIRN